MQIIISTKGQICGVILDITVTLIMGWTLKMDVATKSEILKPLGKFLRPFTVQTGR